MRIRVVGVRAAAAARPRFRAREGAWLGLGRANPTQAHTDQLPAAVESWLRALPILRTSHGDGARLVRELRRDLDGAQAELHARHREAADDDDDGE